MTTAKSKPVLYHYDNYRLYLKDWFAWKKSTDSDFSYRVFSEKTGFKAPNQLLLLIKGERNLGADSVANCFAVLDLSHGEKKYFTLLVKFNQTRKMKEKNACLEELSAYWIKKDVFLKKEQYKYLTNWYYTAIREMVNLKDFEDDGVWISRRLGKLITPEQAQQAIRILLELELLERGENGKLKQTSNYVSTGSEVQDVAGYLYHDQMMRIAHDSLETKSAAERNLTALTFTMRRADYQNVVNEINDFRRRLIVLISGRDKQNEDEDLFQMNVHLFPVTKE